MRSKGSWAVRRVARVFASVGIVALANIYDYVARTRPRTVRKLAGSRAAQAARVASERQLRAIVHAYGALPSLTFRMLMVEDVCSGGGGWTFASGEDHKVACTLYVTAYYSTTENMDVVLDDILTEGDMAASRIVFGHDNQPHVPPDADVHWLFGIGQTLTWDTPHGPVREAAPCTRECDPPVYRCLREGSDRATVAAVRSAHGRVVQLGLNPVQYFRVHR